MDEELSDSDGVELPSDGEGVSELEPEESGSEDGISDEEDSGGLSSEVVVEADSEGDEVGLEGGGDSDESGLEGVSEDTSDPEELPFSEDIPDPEEVGLLEASEEEGSCEETGRDEAGRDEVGREEAGRELLSGQEIVLIREERLDSSCGDVSRLEALSDGTLAGGFIGCGGVPHPLGTADWKYHGGISGMP